MEESFDFQSLLLYIRGVNEQIRLLSGKFVRDQMMDVEVLSSYRKPTVRILGLVFCCV